MRFELLFDDLDAQFDAQLAAAKADERVESERLRAARTELRDRVDALVQAEAVVRAWLVGGMVVELALSAVGRDWLAARLPNGAEAIVPLSSVASITVGAAELRASRERIPASRPAAALSPELRIGVVLRGLARRRVELDVISTGEGPALHGTIDRVGLDHFDLAVHERGVPRRENSVSEHRIIAVGAVAMLRV